MKLSYHEFLLESKEENIIKEILVQAEPTILQMLSSIEKYYIEKLERTFTKYDREISRLNLIWDLVKSIEKYTKPSDTLITINFTSSVKGNIQITAKISRDSQTYSLETEAIYAGGYNIQALHYRYITKTDLPQTNNNLVTAEFSAKIKNLSKAEKLNASILGYEKRLEKAQSGYEINSKISDDEILKFVIEKGDYKQVTWEEIVKRGADKNYDYDKEKFIASEDEYRRDRIDFWKTKNIKWVLEDIQTLKKLIAKDKLKLEAFIKD